MSLKTRVRAEVINGDRASPGGGQASSHWVVMFAHWLQPGQPTEVMKWCWGPISIGFLHPVSTLSHWFPHSFPRNKKSNARYTFSIYLPAPFVCAFIEKPKQQSRFVSSLFIWYIGRGGREKNLQQGNLISFD